MKELNLEIHHGNQWRIARETLPIARPEGFDDSQYEAHAWYAADLVKNALSAEALRVTGVVIMIVEEGVLTEEAIREQFDAASQQFAEAQTWRIAHIVRPIAPQS